MNEDRIQVVEDVAHVDRDTGYEAAWYSTGRVALLVRPPDLGEDEPEKNPAHRTTRRLHVAN